MTRFLVLVLVLGGCTVEKSVGSDGPSDGRTEVALIPAFPTGNNVDILFVIDDSPGSIELQHSLQQAFPSFLDGLAFANGLPNMHIGIASTDLGTRGADDAAAGPGIGAGPGSCSREGKAGNLQTNGSTVVSGTYIRDIDVMGTRDVNYTGGLADALASISLLGAPGCDFPQPIEAARRALVDNSATTGFVRPDASLALIVVSSSDDCSMAHATLLSPDVAALGPLQPFRCTRFGVTCDDGGKTSNDMNLPGTKTKCHSNHDSQYLTRVDATADLIQNLKADHRNVMFGAIAGASTSLAIAMEPPPGGGTETPTLQASCSWSSPQSTSVYPAARILEYANRFRRHHVEKPCGADITPAAFAIGREIRGMLGDACITRPLKTPVDCEAWDERADGSHVAFPSCETQTSDCYRLVDDASCGGGLRVDIVRGSQPPMDTMVSVRCKL